MAHCYLGMNQGTQLRQLFALYLQGVNYIKMVFHYKTMQPCMYVWFVRSQRLPLLLQAVGHRMAARAYAPVLWDFILS